MAEVREPDRDLARQLRAALRRERVEVVGSGGALGGGSVVLWSLPAPPAGLQPLGRAHPLLHALVLVEEPTDAVVAEFLRSGAKAVVDRRDDAKSIAGAAVAVARGYLVLPSNGRRALLPAQTTGGLTEEHLRWMRDLAGGLDVAGLAQRVGCSERAMYRRLRHVYDLLRVPGRAEAFRMLSRASLLEGSAMR